MNKIEKLELMCEALRRQNEADIRIMVAVVPRIERLRRLLRKNEEAVQRIMTQRNNAITIDILGGSTREETARKYRLSSARVGQIFHKVIHAAAPEIAKMMDVAAGGKKNGPACFMSRSRARAEEIMKLLHNA